MKYNDEQRNIIRRMGEITARMEAAQERHRAAQLSAGRNMIDGIAALTQAMEHAIEMGVMQREHGDLFREFLDTL